MSNLCLATPMPIHHCIGDYFKQIFADPPQELIGIELEFPILSIHGKNWDDEKMILLQDFIQQNLCFEPSLVFEGKALAFLHPVWEDKISFEVSHATLEFSLAPRSTLIELETAFHHYFLPIQSHLLHHNLFLGCIGINPFRYCLKKPTLPSPHYLNIISFLEKYSDPTQPDYAKAPWLMIGSQCHLEVPFKDLYLHLNNFHGLGWLECVLLGNSLYRKNKKTWLCFRDQLLRGSGFGYHRDNVVYPSQKFKSNQHYFEEYLNKAIFTKECHGIHHHFEPVSLSKLVQGPKKLNSTLSVSIEDFPHCLAFNPVRLSRYGTIELRSACQQPFGSLFAPAAFQLAIQSAQQTLTTMLPEVWILQAERRRLEAGRRGYEMIKNPNLIEKILHILYDALSSRGRGEEKYLHPIITRFERKSNPAIEQLYAMENGQDLSQYILANSLPTHA